MNNRGKVQRANASEALAVREVLKAIWEKAYSDGSVLVSYPAETRYTSKKKADTLYNALSDHRKRLRKYKTDYWELYLKVNDCSLFRRDDYTVEVKRKAAKHSKRSTVVLDLIHQMPELGIVEPKMGIESIMNDFKSETKT